MIDITTYINEGGFFTNTGANKYIDIIKNFGDIISTESVKRELNKSEFLSDIPKTNIYKKLYDLFNDINKYEVKFDVIYIVTDDVRIEHYVCIRNGSRFSILCDLHYKKQPIANATIYHEYKDASELLSWILYYIRYTDKLDVLRDTAKFTIK